MKVAIMQPYFMPYLGYFSLIKHTDKFIIFDKVQYIRHGWIERNRILKQDGWIYIQVPILKEGQLTNIKDIRINNEQNWKQKIISQLQFYKKKAPYYYSVLTLISDLLKKDFNDIVSLNKESLLLICNYLGINKDFEVYSEMDMRIDPPNAPDEWALNICKALGSVTEYWNPPGGISFFDKTKYEKAGIELKFLNVKLNSYNQNQELFESGLSIIDVLMFNSPLEVNQMLDKFELI